MTTHQAKPKSSRRNVFLILGLGIGSVIAGVTALVTPLIAVIGGMIATFLWINADPDDANSDRPFWGLFGSSVSSEYYSAKSHQSSKSSKGKGRRSASSKGKDRRSASSEGAGLPKGTKALSSKSNSASSMIYPNTPADEDVVRRIYRRE